MLTVERTNRAVITVRCDDIASGWEQWFFLRSDAHHDHKKSNRALQKKHLDEVVKRGAMWADFGDLFDAMQGKYDPRKSYDDIRPEDTGEDYYDRLVIHAAEFYGPYAERCMLLAKGNHETGVLKHASTDVTSNLAFRLNTEHLKDSDHKVLMGGYGGWIRFLFTHNKTKRKQFLLRYMHGAGGGAPVTKGVIRTARQAVYLPDADIVVNGHNHQAYILPLARERITQRGKTYKDIQWHGRIPGYLDEYADGTEGWAIEKEHPPHPFGGIWLKFEYSWHGLECKLIPEFS